MSCRILIGDVRDRLKELQDNSFDCVVTSPPYYGLRDYGVDGQIGVEASPAEHLAVLVEVFREVRRVLKRSGTVWLNYGDCYATSPNGRSAAETTLANSDDRTFRDKPISTVSGKFKPKDLMMLPNRLAIALHDDGWYVRSEIIWGKTNGMPDSSGRFRPSTAHEKIFLLAKDDHAEFWLARDTGEISANPDFNEQCWMVTAKKPGPRWIALGHYYNAAAVRIERAQDEDSNGYPGGVDGVRRRTTTGNTRIKMPDGWDTGKGGHGSFHRSGREAGQTIDRQRGHSRRHQGFNERWDGMSKDEQQANGRLLRNYEPAPLPVWEMATAAFKEAHYATFPPELVERCLKAGCPPKGCVLDPFGGAGTVGLVADRMGLNSTLIELNPAYVDIAERRIGKDAPLLAEVSTA